ncbi:MAG: ADP-ribosylglycohydrolase family protein [Planctomycetota bacterium]
MSMIQRETRRRFLKQSLVSGISFSIVEATPAVAAPPSTDLTLAKLLGLVHGSLLGDAVGGPLEFDENDLASRHMPRLRDGPHGQSLNRNHIEQLAETVPLLGYEELRPSTAPYGPWAACAPAGTVTDDSRHKIVLMDALRRARDSGQPATRRSLAESYLRFDSHPCIEAHPPYRELNQVGHAEFRLAARWVLGERSPELALPPERIWAGTGTCCGMMSLLPLAGALPGRPEAAYRAAFELGFFDNGNAKDINSALVAALSVAITLEADHRDQASRRQAWQKLKQVMLATDPFRYEDSPYTKRPVRKWIEFAEEAVRRAAGVPKELFRVFADECRVEHWWESHLIFVIVLACSELCDYEPLATLHVILDFGYDTDSSAQVLGAIVGALFGPGVFPAAMRKTVRDRFRVDYLEDVEEWATVLADLSDRSRLPQVVAGQAVAD